MNIGTLSEIIQASKVIRRKLGVHTEMTNGSLLENVKRLDPQELWDVVNALNALDRAVRTIQETPVAPVES